MSSQHRFRILELFCGIGGCAAALPDGVSVTAAIDIDREALAVYRANWPHRTVNAELATLNLAAFEADLWWLSPPCLPHTVRGAHRDLQDRRTESLLAVIGMARNIQPAAIVVENVPPFLCSATWAWCWQQLAEVGYRISWSCASPDQIGWPMRRHRAYCVAVKDRAIPTWRICRDASAPALKDVLEPVPLDEWCLQDDPKTRDALAALSRVDPDNPVAAAACFGASYGKSILRAGSYLQSGDRLRRFTPREVARLLGFDDTFDLSRAPTQRAAYRMLGNSLSVPVVRQLLQHVLAWLSVGQDPSGPGRNCDHPTDRCWR